MLDQSLCFTVPAVQHNVFNGPLSRSGVDKRIVDTLSCFQEHGFRKLVWNQRMRCGQFQPLVDEVRCACRTPQYILIHLGKNDLWVRSALALYHEILHNLWAIKITIRGVHDIWSYWLPRRVWRDARSPVGFDKAYQWISNVIAWAVLAEGWSLIAHPSLKFSALHLFCPDRVPLSYERQDVMLANLQRDIVETLRSG